MNTLFVFDNALFVIVLTVRYIRKRLRQITSSPWNINIET